MIKNKVTYTYHVPATFKHFFRSIINSTREVRSHLLRCFLWIFQLLLQGMENKIFSIGSKQTAVPNQSILTSSTTVRRNPSCSGLHPNLLATSHRPALMKVLYMDFLFGLLYCPSPTPASPGGKCKLNLESTSSTSLLVSASFSDLMTDSNN